ncbi:uridine 5'-monophosphate synthase isoform X2 [Periplaneta americana]|uniref:uridine 5'-monophosphate synthase isoform X2 n=1 Tax=Periplaneta americana TaxID=6978 RepID=UPI0037E99CBA
MSVMATFEHKLRELIIKLHEIEVLKFGMFKMKVGIDSPVYFDMRSVVSYPEIMEDVAELLWEFAIKDKTYDELCGVPYAALPIATLISSRSKIPMLIRRKEAKKYGTKKLVEGKFNPHDKCVIIEDVVTSGSSILETVRDLRSEGLDVTSTVVVVDREQGGKYNLSQQGITMHSLCTLSQILQILKEAGRVTQETVDNVKKYLAASQIRPDGSFIVTPPPSGGADQNRMTLSYAARADHAQNPVAAKLFKLMEEKQTNLCVAADVTNASKLIALAHSVGPYICIFKTHIDIVEDFSPQVIQELLDAAQQHNFLLLEDRKFADIGHAVSLQYSKGTHKISSWADLVTVHPVPGENVLTGLKSVVGDLKRGCFLVVEMSSAGNLNTPNYISFSTRDTVPHVIGRTVSL